MKKLITYFILLLIFVSCEKVLDLDTETTKSKLVVNSLFNPNTGLVINVSKSLSVIDNDNLSIVDNATVNLYDGNGNFLETLSNFNASPGDYFADDFMYLITGNEYTVKVSAPNFTSVTASDFCPTQVPIISVDTSSVNLPQQGTQSVVTIQFQDPAGQDNYYGIELETTSYNIIFNNTTNRYDTVSSSITDNYLSTNNPIVDNSGEEIYNKTLIFKDNLFDGKLQSISFKYDNSSYPNSNNMHEVRRIKLISYSENTYKFTKSFDVYLNANGNPFAEPVQVHTNVEGGFGIFGGKSISEKTY